MIEHVAPVLVTSPCTGVCVVGDDGWCEGCARTLDEIAGWSAMTAAERDAVMGELAARRVSPPF